MTSGVTAAVAAAVLMGCYLVGVKRYFSQYPPTLYLALVHGLGLCWYLPAVITTGPLTTLFPPLSLIEAVVVTGTVGLIAVALAAFYHALAIGDVSYVAPISKLVPVFVLPIEVLVLGQQLTAQQIVGVVIATGAVYVANYHGGSFLRPFRTALTRRDALLALISAAIFGIVDVGKRVSMQELAVSARAFVIITLALVPVALAPLALQRRGAVDLRGEWVKLFAAGGILAVGQHLVSVAFVALPASIVSPIVNMQAIVAVILGSVLLGEPHAKMRLVAGGLAVAGVLLISLG